MQQHIFPGDTFEISELSLQFANENNEFVFVANWVEEGQSTRAVYTVEHYYQNPDGTFPAEPVTVILRGTIGREVVALPQERDDYVLDQGNSVYRGTVTPDGKLVLSLYYRADIDENGIPDDCEVTITFSAVNGNIFRWTD